MSEYDRHPLPVEAMVGCLWDRPHAASGRLLRATPLRDLDTGELPRFVDWLDPADLVADDARGLVAPPEPPTLRWLPESERGRLVAPERKA